MSLSHDLVEALVLLISSASAEQARVAVKTLATVVENAKDPTKGVLKTSNTGLQKRILSLEGGEQALVAAGFIRDAATGTLTWDAALDADAAAVRGAALGQAVQALDSIHGAIVSVGDSNTPSVAQEALKLCGTYVGNIATEPDNASRRRIGAANKALNSRLLAATGGEALLAACGFIKEAAVGEQPESYRCLLDTPLVRVALVALGQAPAIWAELAASAGADAAREGPAAAGGSHGHGPTLSAEVQAVAVEGIDLRSLPGRASVLAQKGAADLQPALCKSEDGRRVLLMTWQDATRTWTEQGGMEIPSTEFVWRLPRTLLILVDLGDAHGTGQAVELRAALNADGSALENDYVTARDFIDAHIAEAYARNAEPVLNANYLEEVARKVRSAAAPVLATVRTLKAAMEAQN